MLVNGKGKHFKTCFRAIDYEYKKGITDEFLEPLVFGDRTVKDNDAIIFFNFRADRAKQLTRAFIEKNFTKFKRKNSRTCILFLSLIMKLEPTWHSAGRK